MFSTLVLVVHRQLCSMHALVLQFMFELKGFFFVVFSFLNSSSGLQIEFL
jgi:hypothetical protein